MLTDAHKRLPELAAVRMRAALVGLQLVREPQPRYKVFYRINLLNEGQGSVRLLGRKWQLEDACGNLQIIEAAQVFNNEPVLTPGAVFSFSGCHYFDKPPAYMELRLFGQEHSGHAFITPALVLPLAEGR